MKSPVYFPPKENLKVAFLTAFVPGKEPYDVLERTLSAMVKADYPHDTWLLDEGNDPEAIRICHKYGVTHFTRKGSIKYNTPEGPFKMKTKGGNYNAWFDQFGNNYEFVAQLDVDFVPKKNYLTRTLGYFNDPTVAFVGTPQIYGNIKDSWIVRGAAEQAYNFYGSMQKGLFGADMTLFIGANHVLRVTAHHDIEGYSGHIVEDHLTGMKLYARGWKSVYVGENLAVGEGPATWSAYFSQQMRWAYGLIDILFRHSPKLFRKMKKLHVFNYFLLQQYYFYGLAQVIGIILLCLYFFFGIEITPMPLLPLLSIYIPLIIYQQVFFIWLQRFNIEPKTEKGLMIFGKIINWAAWPIYFLAFVGVLLKKRLSYVVTPKGNQQDTHTHLSLFYPHLILGSLTAFSLIASYINNRQAPQLIFWAAVNTLIMYMFFLIEILKKVNSYSLRIIRVLSNFNTVYLKPISYKTIMVVIIMIAYTISSYLFFKNKLIVYFQNEDINTKIISPIADSNIVNSVKDLSEESAGSLKYLEHTVLPGESLWTIAQKYYGKGADWKRIQTEKGSIIIHPGEIIKIYSD